MIYSPFKNLLSYMGIARTMPLRLSKSRYMHYARYRPPANITGKAPKQVENPFSVLVEDQQIVIVPEFKLEIGDILHDVPVAYKTWGVLNEKGDNVLVICHALTGSADVSDWWGPLLGPGRAFDPTRFFIVCLNSLGSPYGSASPCTIDPATGKYYGPEFPLSTIKDDVRIHRMVLDDLGVTQIASVIGGSMGGMLVLEYAYFGPQYVRTIVPLATCACHSAWGISWGEAQRQSIYSDPKYNDGYYPFDDPPVQGLGAARMAAMLTYRSRNSFEAKFGRAVPDPFKHKSVTHSAVRSPQTPSEEHWAIHNDGNLQGKKLLSAGPSSPTSPGTPPGDSSDLDKNAYNGLISKSLKPQVYFSAQSYLRYQGDKFVKRFDSNCYIAITRKLDTHDVSRGRAGSVVEALEMIQQPTLVIGISSDGLFTFTEQERLAKHIPNSRLEKINSPEGHDAFLLEFYEINKLIVDFLRAQIPDIMEKEAIEWNGDLSGTKSSLFGEAEGDDLDVTQW